ncbi:MAG: hypothetical protein QXD62_02170, partial [Candidatus Woesearchaeota archaeon]
EELFIGYFYLSRKYKHWIRLFKIFFPFIPHFGESFRDVVKREKSVIKIFNSFVKRIIYFYIFNILLAILIKKEYNNKRIILPPEDFAKEIYWRGDYFKDVFDEFPTSKFTFFGS